jgi:hypothetical protein
MENHVATHYMTLSAPTRIVKNRDAKTEYITIPSMLVQDSTYPFKESRDVIIEIVTEKASVEKGTLIVRSRPALSPKRK